MELKRVYPLPAAIAILIIGLLIGLDRYISLYGLSILQLYKLFDIHPILIIYGFISIVILYERFRGLGLTQKYKDMLLIGISINIFAVALAILALLINFNNIFYYGVGLLLIPPITYILYLTRNRMYIYKPVYIMHLASQIIYVLGVLMVLNPLSIDKYIFGLILLLYPTIFILGERLELTRFVAPTPIYNIAIYIATLSIVLSTLSSYIYSGYFSIFTALSTLILALLITYLDPTLKIRSRFDEEKRYLKLHLKIAYTMLVLGLTIYLLGYVFKMPYNIYDVYTHLIALGYIGSMLIGHGPIILSGLFNIKVRYSYIPLYVLLISLILRILTDILFVFIPLSYSQIMSLASGILIFMVLALFLRNTVIYGMYTA